MSKSISDTPIVTKNNSLRLEQPKMSLTSAVVGILGVFVVAVSSDQLVDISDLKVCTSNDDCMSTDKISQLQQIATELEQNLTYGSTDIMPSFDGFLTFQTGTIQAKVMDQCNALGSEYLSEVITNINSDLTVISDYADKLYTSCSDIYDKETNLKNGYYTIQKSDGSLTSVYCQMTTDKCGGSGGWMRIGMFNTNITDPQFNQCPAPLVYKNYDALPSHPLCQRAGTGAGCDSFSYSSEGISYSMVCGRAKAFMYGSPDSFTPGGIDDNYVDGVSVTYGSSPRTHIWSFVGGVNTDGVNHWDCPCNSFNPDNPPPFVGNDYYCESGMKEGDSWSPAMLRTDDPLWDGLDCLSLEGGCCKGSNLPYFVKDLGKTISDDVELRVCDDENEDNERLPLEMLEIYIK